MELDVMMRLLGEGLVFTLTIFVVTLIGAIPLGVPIAAARMSRCKPLAIIARIYISFMRGTPLMLQLFVWMFVPYFVFHISTGTDWKWVACFVGFITNYAAYFAEIYRSGVQSIPRGQYEAAEILGYTRMQTFFYIILPQVVKRIIPAMGNEIITLLKDTSLAFTLTIPEMFSQAKAVAASQVSMVPYAIAAGIYWVFNIAIDFILGRVEKKLSYYHD